ncbi:MAG: hypothetical protein J6R22_04435 [Alphaproteobacteria bacterium]|nr:hypothetical protein [Alphaproteobacteria bacterium]
MSGQDVDFQELKRVFNSSWVNTSRPLSVYMEIFEIPHRDIKKLLQNKKLLLVGGGNSKIQRALNFARISCDVTNVDPYINDKKSANTVINCDFNETRFENEFDEIWALYSLPLYSPDVAHAIEFYGRAAIALKPGGTLRIGGHPKHVNGILAAPVHFPRNNLMFELLDIFLETKIFDQEYTQMPTMIYNSKKTDIKLSSASRHWEKWTAPQNPAIKQALNEHILKSL